MEPENIQGNTYGPVGRCIYCGSDGGKEGLRTEHTVPYSLGGNTELLEASCRDCEAITSYLDGYLARGIFYDLRIQTATQTRRAHPKTRPATVSFQDHDEIREFDIEDHPFFTVVPALLEPGILRHSLPSERFDPYKAHAYHYFPDNLAETLKNILPPQDSGSTGIRAKGILNLATFCRAIAKIAYCHAVIHSGKDGFRPLVIPDIILGKYPYISYFIGGGMDPPPPDAADVRHTITFEISRFGRLRLLVVGVRLFANSGTEEHGMPIYEVVFGASKTI